MKTKLIQCALVISFAPIPIYVSASQYSNTQGEDVLLLAANDTHMHQKATMAGEKHGDNANADRGPEGEYPRHKHDKASMPGKSHSEMLEDDKDAQPEQSSDYPRHKHYKASMPGESHVKD